MSTSPNAATAASPAPRADPVEARRELTLTIAHASAATQEAEAAIATLALPHLEGLLARLQAAERLGVDEYDLDAPHEQVLAADLGWSAPAGQLPFAAWRAAADGLDMAPAALPWGQLTPCHWLVGRDKITLVDPQALDLDETESRALFEALRPSFEAEGWTLQWGAPLRWYARHAVLAELRTASLDRVIGRNLDLWLRGGDPLARRLRRLQVEAQMLWHAHPVNVRREDQGALTVNSFWLSGCGVALTAAGAGAAPGLQNTLDESLRQPLLNGDWAAWCEAWQALDAGPVAALAAAARSGAAVRLTLCGERQAQRWHSASIGWLGRLRRALPGAPRVDAQALLRSL